MLFVRGRRLVISVAPPFMTRWVIRFVILLIPYRYSALTISYIILLALPKSSFVGLILNLVKLFWVDLASYKGLEKY